MGKGRAVDVVCFGFSKAFDMVSQYYYSQTGEIRTRQAVRTGEKWLNHQAQKLAISSSKSTGLQDVSYMRNNTTENMFMGN